MFFLCRALSQPSQAAPAGSACSRATVAVYSTHPVADVYAAFPAQWLPSLQDAIAQRSGCKLNVIIDPPARAWLDFSAGHNDMLISTPVASADDGSGTFLPMLKSPWVLVTPLPAGAVPDRLDDFIADRGWRIGKIRGLPYPPDVAAVLERLDRQQQVDEAVEIDMALNKLENNRDSAVLMTAGAYLLHANRIRAAHLRPIVQPQFAPAVLGIYISRKSLNDTDRSRLEAASRSIIAERLPIRLLRARLGKEDEQLLQPAN